MPARQQPFGTAEAVTPDDGSDITLTHALYIGGGGTSGLLRVDMAEGSTVDFTGLVAGEIYPFRVTRVHATGTDVTDIVALRR